MDKRSWPWKKKTPKETVNSSTSGGSDTKNQASQDIAEKVVSYVQVSQERYTQLSEMEDQVKILNGKLSDATSELTNKNNLIKQHSKVAEEAISGWEKAEAEASALKTQLESTVLLKHTADEKVFSLDSALKECLKQVRSTKEEGEQKLNDVLSVKTKQWESIKLELEAKLNTFEQELIRCSAEYDALSKSIEEHSHMLVKLSEEKSQADAEIEVLKIDIQSYEREISSLKYEVHVVTKELEIRNEEKNMCARSAEAANTQHLEDVKKMTKLEAECQKLRGLVRKKLPGPAALAQMKQEVDSFVSDYGEDRTPRRSPAKCYSPRFASTSDFALESIQQLCKENELLTSHLMAMEEETNKVKKALSDRNAELQASRDVFARTASKLRSVEMQMQVLNQQKCSSYFSPDRSSSKKDIKQNLNLKSDDVVVETISLESWEKASISQVSHLREGSNTYKAINSNTFDELDLMDDFLQMEKLACLSTDSSGTITVSDVLNDHIATVDSAKDDSMVFKSHRGLHPENKDELSKKTETIKDEILLSKLQEEIGLAFESQSKNVNIGKLLIDIKKILKNTEDNMRQQFAGHISENVELIDASCDKYQSREIVVDSSGNEFSFTKNEGLKQAILEIQDFVVSLDKEDPGTNGLSDVYIQSQKVQEFTSAVDKLFSTGSNTGDEFLQALSCILSETKELYFRKFHDKDIEGDSNYYSDCIDKVTLLEKKVLQPESGKDGPSDSLSDSEVLQEGISQPSFEKRGSLNSLKDLEQLKLENCSLTTELNRMSEILEKTKKELVEAEKELAALKSQLVECQKSNSLAETEMKCMTVSYTSLKSCYQDMENEVNMLRVKTETLDNELQEERQSHQDDLEKYKDLHEQMERREQSLLLSDDNTEVKKNQEREFALAAEKLAECQNTILLLGRQLQAMNPPADIRISSANAREFNYEDLTEVVPTSADSKTLGGSRPHVENPACILQRSGESSFNGYSLQRSPAEDTCSVSSVSSKRPNHRSTWSYSSNSSTSTKEKSGRRFSRFFSKGKTDRC